MEIKSRNTNTLAPRAYRVLQEYGILDQSRNGPVLRMTEPLSICLSRPWERVNVCPKRDANPFFHMIEACAMLADENNTRFLTHFAKQMAEYSDNGFTQNAFYGSRLRSTFGQDQLNRVIANLQQTPHSRQEVALMWDPDDLRKVTKDKACNLMLLFAINHHNQVTMTSFNRSNDAIWGSVSGANVVHLSIFHEYVALSLGRSMGDWWHVSNNFHIYTDNPKWDLIKDQPCHEVYDITSRLTPLFSHLGKNEFDRELSRAVSRMIDCYADGGRVDIVLYANQFVRDAITMFNVWQMHKSKQYTLSGLTLALSSVKGDDWRIAATAWLERRYSTASVHTGNVLST